MIVHHIGYLVKDICSSCEKFLDLGYVKETDAMYDKNRDIYILFLVNGSHRIELVQPASENSSYYTAMKRFKNLPYHICYETPNISDTIERLMRRGFKLSKEPEIAPCIRNHMVAFMQSPEIGIIELVEMEEK